MSSAWAETQCSCPESCLVHGPTLADRYSDLVERVTLLAGGRRTYVEAMLGLSDGTIHYRLNNPSSIRRESVLGLELLEQRLLAGQEFVPTSSRA